MKELTVLGAFGGAQTPRNKIRQKDNQNQNYFWSEISEKFLNRAFKTKN